MSPAERAFWIRANRRASTLSPELARALLRAFAILRESLSDDELSQLITSGQLDGILTNVLDEATMAQAFIPVRARIRDQVDRNFTYFARDLPGAGKINGTVAVAFDVLNPRIIDGIRQLDTKVIQTLQPDIRETVRAFVENGLRDGIAPRSIARQIRDVIGMSPTQLRNAETFEAKLRDAGTPEDRIAKQVAAYRKRAISLNAETNARTAALDAMKLGQRLSWEQAADAGIVDRDRLTKTWRGVLDLRERLTHVAMEGQTVPFDALFSNGQMIPGDTEYSCRCIPIYRHSAA